MRTWMGRKQQTSTARWRTLPRWTTTDHPFEGEIGNTPPQITQYRQILRWKKVPFFVPGKLRVRSRKLLEALKSPITPGSQLEPCFGGECASAGLRADAEALLAF